MTGLLFMGCLGSVLPASAQRELAGINVGVDKKIILIGEVVDLRVTCRFPTSGGSVSWPVIPDTLGRFEVIRRLSIDSTEDGGVKTFTARLQLTSFDSGHQVLPSITFEAGNRRYASDTIGIDVGMPALRSETYHDIRDMIETESPPFPFRGLLSVLAGIFLLLLIGYWWRSRRRKGPRIRPGKLVLSGYQDTLDALSALRQELVGREAPAKDDYRRLYDLFRAYLVRDHGMPVMTETTDEILLRLKEEKLTPPQLANVAAALRLADAVKFARYTSSKAEALSALDEVVLIIHILHPKNQPLA